MKIERLLLLLTASVSLTSCGKDEKHVENTEPIVVLGNFHTDQKSLNIQSKKVSEYDFSYDKNKLSSAMASCNLAVDNKNYGDILDAFTEVMKEVNIISDKYNVANVKYRATLDGEFHALENAFLSYYQTYSSWLKTVRLNAKSKNNNDILRIFFPSQSDEEIAEYFGTGSGEEHQSKLNEQMNKCIDDAAQININDANFWEKAVGLAKSYAEVSDEYANYYGYDSYLDYLYDTKYHRDYTHKESKSVINLITSKLTSKYKKPDFSEFDEDTMNRVNKSFEDSFASNSVNLGNEIDRYSNFIGESYFNAYTYLFNDGYYLFSNNEKSTGTAFNIDLNSTGKTENLVYFSSKNQKATIVVHEFGHYAAHVLNTKNIAKSFDINETFSKGNEALFAIYLTSINNDPFYKAYAKSELNEGFKSLFNTAYAVEVENYVFDNYKTLSVEEMIAGIKTIYKKYPSVVSENYWWSPMMNSTAYYISYATSQIEALQLYFLAKNNLNNARDSYMNLMLNNEEIKDVELWKKAGLLSPFDETTINELASILETF